MPRHHRRWEEPATSSNRGSGYSGHSHYDNYSWRHYTPSAEFLQSMSFNYWREDAVATDPYHPWNSYGWESYDEQWRDGNHSRQPSYPRQRRDFGPSRDWDDLQSRRDRNLPFQDSSRQRYSTYAPAPYIPRPTFRPRSPVGPMLQVPKPAAPPPPRKPSPSPKKSLEPLKPSSSYLSLSQKPSQILHDPEKARKFLVLDLNGTLLIRSPRSRASSARQLRPVQPRPYMQSFRQYLFCPNTKAWLDTMVWSSAQPHSVDDMVDKVFGASKGELKAVWNRKSLGLSEAEYHQKAVTTKDLTKPWNLFASALSPVEGHPTGSSHSESIHSALTTLLLDDSPHKAALQPYNHVCIPEYNSARRQHDLQSLLVTRGSKDGKQSKKAKQKNQVETGAHLAGQLVPEPSPQESAEKEPYDVILLAIIGVLETVKLQSNVAGWIRKGGLWAAQESLDEDGVSDVKHRGAADVGDSKATSDTVVNTGNDESSTSDPGVTSEQAHLQAKMWFDDSLVLAYWVAQGRKALMDLGIQAVPGVTG